MDKEALHVLAAIEDAKAKDLEKKRLLKQEKEAALAKIEEAKGNLEIVEDPEEYKELRETIKEQEAYLAFLSRKKTKALGFLEPDYSIISKEEYKDMCNSILESYRNLQEAMEPKLRKILNSLITAMDEYSQEAEALDEVYHNLQLAVKQPTANYTYKRAEIAKMCDDAEGYGGEILRSYLRHRSNTQPRRKRL